MAAILCKGFGDICSKVCSVPGQLCSCVCTGCGTICTLPCKILIDVCSSPFFCYVAVATALNLPPLVLGARAIPDFGNCNAGLWLSINMIFCILHIAAAIYFSYSIRHRKDPQLEAKTTTIGKAGHLLCYDPVIAVYILVYIGSIGWLCTGAAWRFGKDMDDEDICGNKMEHEYVKVALGCGGGFLIGGFFAFMLSLCCSAFDRAYYTDETVYHVADPNKPQSQPTTTQSQPQKQATATPPFESDTEASIPVATPVHATPVDNTSIPSGATASVSSSRTGENAEDRSKLEDYGAKAGKALNDLISKVNKK